MRIAAFCGLRGREAVVSHPGRVGAVVEQQLGGLVLPTVRGAPQSVVEILLREWRVHASWARHGRAARARPPARGWCARRVRAGVARRPLWPKATASAIAVPPPITAPSVSMAAPASSSASSASMSSLLAAQCSGVSLCGPVKRALTSAPAAASARTWRRLLGRSRPVGDDVQQRPRLFLPGVAERCGASSGCSRRSRSSSAASPDLDELGHLARQRPVRFQSRRVAGHAGLWACEARGPGDRPAPAHAAARSG